METIANINIRTYIELREILKYTDKSIVEKIPTQILDKINSIETDVYTFNYDFSKTLNEQDILQSTKELLSALYIRYCCDEENARRLISICKENDLKQAKKYDIKWDDSKAATKIVDSINENNFENYSNKVISPTPDDTLEAIKMMDESEASKLIVPKQGFIKKLINKIKSIFIR